MRFFLTDDLVKVAENRWMLNGVRLTMLANETMHNGPTTSANMETIYIVPTNVEFILG